MQRNHEMRVASPGPIALRAFLAIAWTLVAATAQSAVGATVALRAARNGDAIDIHASALLNADGATAWRVLTDYNRYPEFIPDLRFSHVVARRDATGDRGTVGGRAALAVSSAARNHFPNRGIAAGPPAFARRCGHVARADQQLRAQAGIRRNAARLRRTCGARDSGFFGPFERTVVERNIARQFQALADEIERQSVAARTVIRSVVEARSLSRSLAHCWRRAPRCSTAPPEPAKGAPPDFPHAYYRQLQPRESPCSASTPRARWW